MKPEILCVGHDQVLNRTRRMILQKCFEVKIAVTLSEAMALLCGQRFDLVLLCYTLADEECRTLIACVHNLPTPVRILALAQGRDRLLLGQQDEEFLSGGPADLLRKAASMAGLQAEDPGSGTPGSRKPASQTE